MASISPWSACLLALATPACCVAGTTLVRTATGARTAASLVVGDRVLSIDITTGRQVENTIVQIRRATRECLELRCSNAALVCTPDHPIYDPTRGAYHPASDWADGKAHELLVHDGEAPHRRPVVAVTTYVGVHEVLDLSLAAEPHNFIADDVIVHNKTLVGVHDLEPPTYIDDAIDGPDFTLTDVDDARGFLLRACLDDADTSNATLIVTAHPSTTATLAKDEYLWLAMVSDLDPDAPITEVVPETLLLSADLPHDACSVGFHVDFQRVQGPDGAEITVKWDFAVTAELPTGAPGTLELTVEADE